MSKVIDLNKYRREQNINDLTEIVCALLAVDDPDITMDVLYTALKEDEECFWKVTKMALEVIRKVHNDYYLDMIISKDFDRVMGIITRRLGQEADKRKRYAAKRPDNSDDG